MFDLSDHYDLQEGITTKERVLRIMGLPTILFDIDEDEAWIYFAEEVNYFLFFKPKIISRNLLIVKFDEANVIKDLQRLNLSHEKDNFYFASQYTAISEHKTGFFKSIFSNIGQVKPQ